jgi:glucose dehydrogenase
MRSRRRILLLSFVALALASCGGSNKSGVPKGAPGELSTFSDQWPAPNQDLANSRVATGSKIDSGNVNQLGVAWTIPIKGGGTFGNYASTPIVADGVVYTQDLTSNVKAIDLQTGQVKWSKDYNAPDVGPNGVAIGYGKIYGATSDFAFALDKDTGKEVWRSQKLTRNANEGIDMAPGVFDGTVYISTVPGNAKSFYKGDGAGVLWALDADTGKAKWKFWTVPENLWSAAHTDINSGGGLWHPPAFDSNGDVYIDVANPAPWPGTNKFPWGSSRPGPNPHTNTLLKLNRQDGKIIWERQVLPHDVFDNCGSCHRLGAAGTTGSVGPNLDELKPNEATVQKQVENGGSGMPSFSGRLSAAEITAVANYVAQNAGKVSSSGGGGGP